VESLGWIDVETAGGEPLRAIGTLGPAGTSSEQAAGLWWRHLSSGRADPPAVRLFDTYEAGGAALRAGEVSHCVVANAYKAINEFYMDTRLAVSGVFVMDTPLYGLAKRRGSPLPVRRPSIATHPSPVPLIRQLLPAGYTAGEITTVNSTSAAARAVRDGAFELALTTKNAADTYDLEFISPTRPIRMVWSVFVADPAQRLAGRPTPRGGTSAAAGR
jgi:prephenate dehydratase